CRCQFRAFHIGIQVRPPQYGVDVVKALTDLTADISFDDARRTIVPASSELTPAEPIAAVSELQVPLSNFIRETAHAVVEALGLEKDDTIVQDIANRWQSGTLLMRPPSRANSRVGEKLHSMLGQLWYHCQIQDRSL